MGKGEGMEVKVRSGQGRAAVLNEPLPAHWRPSSATGGRRAGKAGLHLLGLQLFQPRTQLVLLHLKGVGAALAARLSFANHICPAFVNVGEGRVGTTFRNTGW